MSALAHGSVSVRLYPHNELGDPVAVVEEQRAQARLVAESGFAGVMTSEHHGGFAGYAPNPLQAAAWLLDAMPSGWCAPCPLLLPLRPVALVAEEVAWLAARFPGRVAVGVAPGALPLDFEAMGVPFEDKVALRDQPGTAGSDARDGLSLAGGAGAAGEQDAEPVVVGVAEASS